MRPFVALLRGINVGGRNRLPMAALRGILADLGAEDVKTCIQSGNAVFEAEPGIADRIEKDLGPAIGARHGFEPGVLVLALDDLRAACEANPFPEAEPRTLHFYFLESAPAAPDLERIDALRAAGERYELIDRVFFLHAPDGIGRSKLAAGAEKALGVACTGRNRRTVQAIVELAGSRDTVRNRTRAAGPTGIDGGEGK